ncbi:MAG: T9SS type A sorting domain-containing protein [Bacteroidetes bacterium]|nr:T9SS type A sorting domain-containing protein [Bacteroidota bacterium]
MKTKKITFLGMVTCVMLLGGFSSSRAQVMVNDSVQMGASYANEVYYSMANGNAGTALRDSWDIAFRTSIMSSSIIINDGTGVVLYTYPNADTSGWNTLDTAGFSTWTPMYNDPADWENGAFSRNALGHPDYGWGIYNSTTHNLKGDSIFIIKLRNESFRKFWVVKKLSSLDTYIFRFAFLDGSDEHEITLDLNPYLTKDFLGYNLAMNTVVDFQPPKMDWDVVFTKYMSVQPDGTPYPVTGVLSNDGTGVARFDNVPTSFTNWGESNFDPGRSVIGWNWKVFDMGTFSYKIVDSLVFFVQPTSGDVYKLLFSRFDGSSTGKVVMKKAKLSAVGVPEVNDPEEFLSVYPNPATGNVIVNMKNMTGSSANLKISDLLGKTVYSSEINITAGGSITTLPLDNIQAGIYIVRVGNGNFVTSQKLVVKK